MATTVSFALLSSSSAISGIKGPSFVGQPVRARRRFVSGASADGTRYTYQPASLSLWLWEMQFDDLTAADKQSLESFFLNDARGPSEQFTYTHTDGTAYTARFDQDQLVWTRSGPNLWAIALALEVTTEPQ